ncbi:sensor histidine kinase [Roseobacter sp. YSTF-M11]|uniref:histidine kinase n=1 Tax=Roseobacter insulae TaxID=2859783 RepID=A0A9X1K4H5_9RHOB|nr:sensor histidine kinase [Roseobacter insulae]MBW4709722.1 sensor histidine kinase [Roseobacter insulae]
MTAVILPPLMLVAVLVGLWQLYNARQTATDVFNKSLLAAALAVANDVTISGGDALSGRTRDILSDTSGGPVFYHVYAPDGVIVAGYATPPVGIPIPSEEASAPNYFDASYLGSQVHGVRLQNRTQIDGFAGVFTTTVWQDASVRAAFVRDLLLRSLLAITGLIAALGLIVWFGVRIGLRPLTDLEAAIASRNSDELTPIQRAVPTEVGGIVATLNRLFGQVTRSMAAQSEFISNAAHQLRNPIAGVLSLAEAVDAAPTMEESRKRSRDLLDAARETANLSQQLLLLERAKSISPNSAKEAFDLDMAFQAWADEFTQTKTDHPVIRFVSDGHLGAMTGDETMIREALRNLVDNALRHGGPQTTYIDVEATQAGGDVLFAVTDDGRGLTSGEIAAARERFRTVSATSGSGLGVSIVEAVARGHDGALELVPRPRGLRVELRLPVGQPCKS